MNLLFFYISTLITYLNKMQKCYFEAFHKNLVPQKFWAYGMSTVSRDMDSRPPESET